MSGVRVLSGSSKVIIPLIISALFSFNSFASQPVLGEIYEVDGVKGLVFFIDSEGHGTMICVDAFRGDKIWCRDKKHFNKTKAVNMRSGNANTRTVSDYIKKNNLDPEIFPIFKWCRDLGDGWYIPSAENLKVFIDYWQGNTTLLDWDSQGDDLGEVAMKDDNHARTVNEKIIAAGGVPFNNYIYTSTETPEGKVYTFLYNRDKRFWKFMKLKKSTYSSWMTARAFYDF